MDESLVGYVPIGKRLRISARFGNKILAQFRMKVPMTTMHLMAWAFRSGP